MNRNVESHFSQIPSADIQRSRFDRSQDVKFTFNVGELIPFFVEEVLPGDTFDIESSKVIRLQTLLTPVMDNIYLDTYWFFVPNRLTWIHWKNFMGEADQAWRPSQEYVVPRISFSDTGEASGTGGGNETGSILDYMGIPLISEITDIGIAETQVNALPLRAYDLIYSEWFRDENLIDPVNVNISDSTTYWDLRTQKTPYKVAKYHDVFTSALPAPQRGPSVAVPVYQSDGKQMPVFTGADAHTSSGYALFGNVLTNGSVLNGRRRINLTDVKKYDEDVSVSALTGSTASTPSNSGFEPTNLYASINAGGVGIGINDLRYAIQVQKFYEALARGGSRYIEIIAQMFNVTSPDARMQRPEYLGGNRIPISIHQITNQSQGESDFLGDLGAMSLTTDRHSDFVKSFTEHGFIIGLVCARYDHSYPQGLEKFWMRKDKFNYYWPVFANLGEEAVYKEEIYFTGYPDQQANAVTAYKTFGYQERWYDYRYKPNRVAGEMRPGISNTLDSWHFADYYTESPTLSQSWIEEDKTNVDRTLAVTSAVSNQIFCDIYVKNFATRPLPMFSIPGLMDHH